MENLGFGDNIIKIVTHVDVEGSLSFDQAIYIHTFFEIRR